jgi:molecular chaperone DnaK (HSP70)
VGIDLGTTFSVIAIRTDEGTKVFRDKQGRALVPSGVYFGQDGSERDSRALLL